MKKIGIIGCGLRSNCYMIHLKEGLGKEWRVEGVADPNPDARAYYTANYGIKDQVIREFSTGSELIEQIGDKLDAVIIASPNSKHLESVVPAINNNYSILLEKPVATTAEGCKIMWETYKKGGRPPLLVGFVLRYTGFYRKAKELIESGEIGDILSIEANEMMGVPLTALFMRSWRRNSAIAGSIILEKCCHDMDLLNWFADSIPARVSSFGSLTRFTPQPEAAANCRDCKIKERCRYNAETIVPYSIGTLCQDTISKNDICVFNGQKSIIDHQVVNIEYENGVLATFSLCADQPGTNRSIKINGTNRQIVGDIDGNNMQVVHTEKYDDFNSYTKNIPIIHDNSGHCGGDSIISGQFKSMLRADKTAANIVGLKEGIEACLVCFAAEESRLIGKIVEIKKLRNKIFG
ncbi:MAG: Gfo/Idh/MocA family oxidoreductase [Kiritimatiellia bacterium]|nr:Gfo/Idh/MocA family oxidoreductase [Kiritimatiellia bacterium]